MVRLDWFKVRFKKILFVLVLFFAVFTLTGFWVLPPIIKSIAASKLSVALQREVSIEQIRVNPYALSLTVRGFQVKEKGAPEKFVAFNELYVNLQAVSLFKRALVLKQVRLKEPYLRILRQEETKYNFSDLLDQKGMPADQKVQEKKTPFRFSINNIEVENGSIDFLDGYMKTNHSVREMMIGVPFLSNMPTQVDIFVQPVFSAKINDTPYVIQGKTKPFEDSLETVIEVDSKDLDIPYYLAYFPSKFNFKIVSALLDTQARISFRQDKSKGTSLTVTGNIALKKLALQDMKKTPLFSLPLLEIGIAPTEPLKKIIHLSKVSIQSPEMRVERDAKGQVNLLSLIPPAEKGVPAPAPAPEKKKDAVPLSIEVDEVRLTGGKVGFRDLSRKTLFRTVLYPIDLSVDHFSNGKDRKTAYTLSLATESKESIRVEGELTLDPPGSEGGFEIKSVPLKKYSPYYQDRILFGIEDGRMDLSTKFRYAAGSKDPEMILSALSIILNSVRLKRQNEQEDFLKIPILSLGNTHVDFKQKKVTVGNFFTEKGIFSLNRLQKGELDLMNILPAAPPAPETPDRGKKQIAEKNWTMALRRLTIDQYAVKMGDHTLTKPQTLLGEKISVRGEDLSTQKNVSGKLSLSFVLDKTTSISVKNSVVIDPLKVEGAAEVKHLVFSRYAPYYQDRVLFDIEEGDLDLSTNYQYRKTEKETVTRLTDLAASVRDLSMRKRDENQPFLSIPLLSIKKTALDLNHQTLTVGEVSSRKGTLLLTRGKDGKLNIQNLFPAASPPASPPEKVAAKPWLLKMGKLALGEYKVGVTDFSNEEPANLEASSIQLSAENLSTAKDSKGNASLSFVLNRKGSVSVSGPVGIEPLFADLKVNLKEIELLPYQPYFADRVNIVFAGGHLSTAGSLQLRDEEGKGLRVLYKGESALNDLATVDKVNSEDLLKWKSLALSNMEIGINPLLVSIEGVALTDFYARVIIHPNGTVNLQQIMVDQKEDAAKSPPRETESKQEEKKPAASETSSPRNIKIDRVTFQGGNINYSDHFIKPNVTANIFEMGGKVSGLSSQEDTAADVELRGKFGQQSSPVEIVGKVNPLKKDLFLDMNVSFKDIELSLMSAYAGRYAGYGIEKGKLFLDLKYLIKNRKLEAQNRIFLDQFTFGEKVDSPEATKLPVKLAVALLKNRRGEIDLNIPVSGSLDDPKFSIFSIVVKIIVNLLSKAATSPFSLIAAAFGGGEQLDFVEFDYGRSEIRSEGLNKLNTLIKALHDRTSIRLDIGGYVDPEKDREALKQLFFERKPKAQKVKDLVKKGQPAPPVDHVKIEPAEYGKYLKMAYKEERFPKPRNILGMVKNIPASEMEKLIFAHIEVKESDLKLLAAERAQKVKDYILKSNQVEPERIFLLESRATSPGKKEKVQDSRVEFKLK